MHIDCDSCTARGPACGDCVVSVLLGAPVAADRSGVELDGTERAALAVLAGSGLVPPLRMAGRDGGGDRAHPGSPVDRGRRSRAG